MKNYRIGASLEVRFEKTMKEFIEWCHEIGLNHVEIKRDHNFLHFFDIEEISKLLKKYNITLGYHAPYRDFNLSSINPHTQRNCINQIKEIIELTRDIGGEYVNIHLGYIPDYYPEIAKAKARENCLKSVKEIAKFASELEVKLCIENDPHKQNMLQFGEHIQTLTEIINEVDAPIWVTLDIGHANTSKLDIFKFIEVFNEKLYVIHIHDNDGTADSHLPPGKGNINFEKIIKTLSMIKNDLIFVFEMKEEKDIYESKEKFLSLISIEPYF